jgi:hypothetical protein
MNKYMLLYMAPMSSEEQMQAASAAEGQQVIQQWMDWYARQGAAIVDGGVPLATGTIYTTATSAQAQAPYVAGYSIVQAADKDAARQMISDHPHLMLPGASIQVLEMLPMPTSM